MRTEPSTGASSGRAWSRWTVALMAMSLAASSAPLRAQQTTISGVVVSAESLQPLAGAAVQIVGTQRGVTADAQGQFRIPDVDQESVTLRVSMIGFRAVTVEARPGQADLSIELDPSAIELDRIVVTGTAGQRSKRSLGNTVATVNASEILETVPVTNVAEVLNGRTAGVAIIHTTGMVGGGNRVRVRGAGSFSLSNEPLVYVDGVRVNNNQATGPISQAFESRPISRWNDFNPEDIESIEVIKGPAAATLYGTEASNGVVQIITKKGRTGDLQFNLSVKQGASWWNPESQLWTNYFDVDGDYDPNDPSTVESIDIVELENDRLNNCTRGPDDFFTACPVRPIWRTGHQQQYDLSASGGSETVRYYLSGGFENAEGVDYDNGRKQYSGRVNVTAAPSEKVEISGNIGYTSGRTNLAFEAGGGGATWTTFYARPDQLDRANRGFWSWTPEAYEALGDIWQDLERTTLSLNVQHRPSDWFSHRLSIGRDYTNERDVEIFNHDKRWLDLGAAAGIGSREQWDRGTDYTTLDYTGTFRFMATPDVESNTSIGGQFYRRYEEWSYAFGENFPVPGLTSIDATTQNRTSEGSAIENVTLGIFLQQQFSWRNRLFLTGAVRADDNSAFGDNFDLVYYPKVSGAWVISEEPFWSLGGVSTLRLRAAYGESGQQPDAFVALQTFQTTPGPGGGGTVSPDNLGNPDLGPEVGKEIEFGFDAGLFDERLALEFTFYDQRTTDAILLREIAPSTGFAGEQYVNAGEIRNRGIELLVRGTPWRTQRHGLDLDIHVATNSNEIRTLGDVTDEDFISAGDFNRHQIGYPVGSWFGERLVSAELDENGNAINVMCDDGQGGTIACADAPALFLGRVTPKVEGGFGATLTLFERFRLFGQMDFKTGFSKLDGNRRVRCWFFDECEENWFPQRFDPVRIASVQNAYVDGLIDDADFLKLREVSLSYTLPTQFAGRFGASRASITIAGRNLATWTKFDGLEPESAFNGGTRGGNHTLWEQNVLPQVKQFTAALNVTF